MQIPTLKSRKLLSQRHRLSHQQIDELLDENKAGNYISEKYEQLFQVKGFFELTDQFRNENIPFTPLKGPLLSYKLHEDPSYRYSHDLDFLVPEDCIKKAISILERNGYKFCYFAWPSKVIEERILLRSSNQIMFSHPEKNINIEIHWKLFKPKLIQSKILKKLIAANSNQLNLNGREFKVFDSEFELLYLIIHGGLHSWFRLKWLVDVKNYIEKIPINNSKFLELVRQFQADRMVALCNSVLAIYFPDCKSLPVDNAPKIYNRSKFAFKQIEDNVYYRERSIHEKLKIYWNILNCFSGLAYTISFIGVIVYGKYQNMFLIDRS